MTDADGQSGQTPPRWQQVGWQPNSALRMVPFFVVYGTFFVLMLLGGLSSIQLHHWFRVGLCAVLGAGVAFILMRTAYRMLWVYQHRRRAGAETAHREI